MKIIVTGSLAFDQIMDFPGKFSEHILPEKIHQINLSFLVNKLTKQRGGTAGNIAYNLALLGMKPAILATAGYDFIDYRKELVKVGVDDTAIRITVSEPTASAFIFTDQADNQITGFYPGAMRFSNELSITNALSLAHRQFSAVQNPAGTPPPLAGSFRSSKIGELAARSCFVVISPNDPQAMMNFVRECRKDKIPYMFDPGMQLPRLSDEDLKMGIEQASIVIGNDYEISLIKRRIGEVSIYIKHNDRELKGTVKSKILITTLGEKGAEIKILNKQSFSSNTKDQRLNTIRIPSAKPKEVLDPTGAGDAFRAGFLAGYLSGQPLDVCGKMGSVAAVYTVEKYGTQTHKFTKKEFEKRYSLSFPRRRESRPLARNLDPRFPPAGGSGMTKKQ